MKIIYDNIEILNENINNLKNDMFAFLLEDSSQESLDKHTARRWKIAKYSLKFAKEQLIDYVAEQYYKGHQRGSYQSYKSKSKKDKRKWIMDLSEKLPIDEKKRIANLDEVKKLQKIAIAAGVGSGVLQLAAGAIGGIAVGGQVIAQSTAATVGAAESIAGAIIGALTGPILGIIAGSGIAAGAGAIPAVAIPSIYTHKKNVVDRDEISKSIIDNKKDTETK